MSYGTPPPPPPAGYGAPMPAANHPQSTTILVLGILSLVCCGLFTGIPAIFMGRKAQAEIAASGGTIGGEGTVKAGYICGIIGTILSALGILFYLIVFIAALSSGSN